MSMIDDIRVSRRAVLGQAASLLALAGLRPAKAQGGGYPSKPVRFIVPFAAGGGTDILARHVGRAIEPILGQPAVVLNHPGAGGGIGTDIAARAAPDGYTFVLGTTATHAMNEFLYSKLSYDPVKDFVPVTLLIRINNVLTVPADSPIRTFEDLVRAAKAAPGKLTYGIVAIGSSSHLASEKLKFDAGIEAVGVPYNSQVAGMSDLIAGRLDFMFDSVGNAMPHLRTGKLRALATTDLKRSPYLPDVPTIDESGIRGFTAPGWVGLFAPAGTPAGIVQKVYEAVTAGYRDPKIIETARSGGLDLDTMAPVDYRRFVMAERDKWGKVIRDAKISLD